MVLRVHTTPFRIDKWGVKSHLGWNDKAITSKLNANFGIGSSFLKDFETELLKDIEPYIPKLTGDLIQSGYQGYRGQGFIKWGGTALSRPYAVNQFWNNRGKESGKRGKFWTNRWIADGNVPAILAKIARKHGVKTN